MSDPVRVTVTIDDRLRVRVRLTTSGEPLVVAFTPEIAAEIAIELGSAAVRASQLRALSGPPAGTA